MRFWCLCLEVPSASCLFVLTRHFGCVLQNWAGMRCPYKLLRMILALVCSKLSRQTLQRLLPSKLNVSRVRSFILRYLENK